MAVSRLYYTRRELSVLLRAGEEGHGPRRQGAPAAHGGAGRQQGNGLQEEEERELEQAGALVDMIVLELFGCWSKYEDMVCGGGKGKGSGASPSSSCMSSGTNTPVGSSNDSSELVAAVPLVVGFLHQLLPLLLQFFVHPVLKVSNSTLPSCARLVMILRTQQQRAAQLQTMQTGEGGAATVFRAEDFLNPLLSAVYSRSQYPADFDFDAAQEDELDEETEVYSLYCTCSSVYCVCSTGVYVVLVYVCLYVYENLRLFATGLRRC